MAGIVEDGYFLANFREACQPIPDMTLSEWSDKHRILSRKASSSPGPWSTDRTPYLREIMDKLSPSSAAQEIVFVSGSQVGKTEVGLNWAGMTIHLDPWPMLMIQPTVDIAKRFSKQRLQSLIDDSPELSERVKASKSRDSGNTLMAKESPGMVLLLAGANSAAGLKSMPIAKCHGDEIDTWPGDVDGEGDPIELVRARTRTFARRKCLWTSTPTQLHRSRIWRMWEGSSKARYFLPCPHCSHMQTLEWERLRYDADDLDGSTEPVMICESCGEGIQESQKLAWYQKGQGEWRHEEEDLSGTNPGYHVSSLYSPLGWFSWRDAIKKWESVKEDPEEAKVFINTILGQPTEEKGEVPEWEALYRRRSSYEIGVVPPGGLLLTAGVDVQRSPGRLECEIVAWGSGLRSWSVDYIVLEGDTGSIDSKPWRELGEILRQKFPCEGGGELPISRMAVDSGDQTQTVYAWVRDQKDSRLMATKGRDSQTQMISMPTTQEVTYKGRRYRHGVKLWNVGVSSAKSELYGWLRQDPPLQPDDPMPRGWCHFPQYTEEYFQGLTAEELRVKKIRGFPEYRWEKIRRRNEPLDCRVYARAALASMGADRWKPEQWEQKAAHAARRSSKSLGEKPPAATKPPADQPAEGKKKRGKSRKGGSWLRDGVSRYR